MDDGHTPVLLDEVLAALAPRPGETAADLTAGLGGHAAALAERLAPGGTLLLADLDAGNLARAERRVGGLGPGVAVETHHTGFAAVPGLLRRRGLAADAVLADLGFSSNQVDDPARGLSFRADGPLDMRLDPSGGMTAAELVNETPEGDLAELIYRYGEERASRRIARAIVRRRAAAPFQRTGDLAAVVRRAAAGRGEPGRGGPRPRIDPATRTFQAIRIAVNGELESLDALLREIGLGAAAAAGGRSGWLRPGARVGLISFHSLEDRPIKHAMQAWERAGLGSRATRKPVVAGEAEAALNRRSRSAKFRVFVVGEAGSAPEPHGAG